VDISPDVVNRIQSFSHITKIQQLALSMIAHQCNPDEVHDNQKIFLKMDQNNDGYITLKELREALQGRYNE
jgi:Ca2+-binding EF-hand superfamily protein